MGSSRRYRLVSRRRVVGSWGGKFYGNGSGLPDHPTSFAGTFGATDGERSFAGSFGAHKQQTRYLNSHAAAGNPWVPGGFRNPPPPPWTMHIPRPGDGEITALPYAHVHLCMRADVHR